MYLIGTSGHRYGLSDHIAGGGEGDLYAIMGDKYHVAKVYKSPTKFREEKVRAMVLSPLRDSKLLAWPKDALYDSGGNFRGFVMDRIYGGESISAIYEIGSKAKYSNTPWTHRVVIAINLCCALNAVHDAGQVIGDFNPKNMFVNMRSGHVKLVDTDSYHINSNGKVYGCMVSMPNYLAPEIAKRLTKGRTLESLKAPTFTESSDDFSLAIHIYQLLMNGAHPFQGALRPGSDVNLPTIRDNILSGTVPSMDPDGKHIVAPSYAPRFSSLPDSMKLLFSRAFLTKDNRPSSKEWHSALIDYRNSLKQCRRNPVHYYHEGVHSCPLCLAESNYSKALGRMMSSSRHNPRMTSYCSAFYTDIPDDIPNGSIQSVAESLIQDQSPIDESYLIDLCRRYLSDPKPGKAVVRKILREDFFHVEDGPFVTYALTPSDYDRFRQYRRMPDGKRAKSISQVSYLDMRNALLSVIKDRGAVHLSDLILETERRLGYRYGSPRSSHRLGKAIATLITAKQIVESNDYYRLA